MVQCKEINLKKRNERKERDERYKRKRSEITPFQIWSHRCRC
jgi:hypothetical protein